MGALSLIDDLDEHFLVMNGDVLTDLPFAGLLDQHAESGAAATIAAHRREVQISLGVLGFDDGADPERLTGYVEKPTYDYEVSMGVYAFSRRVLEYIEPGERLDFPDLILRLIEAGETVRARRSRRLLAGHRSPRRLRDRHGGVRAAALALSARRTRSGVRLEGLDLVCVGFADWDAPLPTNQHQLMRRLARRNRILFVESLGLRGAQLRPQRPPPHPPPGPPGPGAAARVRRSARALAAGPALSPHRGGSAPERPPAAVPGAPRGPRGWTWNVRSCGPMCPRRRSS